jgi:nitrite reductase (NADH) small subunit
MRAACTPIERHLGPLARIPPGEGREFRVDGRRIAVFRLRDGSLAATDALCPHRGGPLADGIVGMGSVICPLHGMRFGLEDGAAQHGEYRVGVHPVRVDDAGGISLTLPREDG